VAGSRTPLSTQSSGSVWAVRAAVAVAFVVAGYLTFEFGRIQADYNVVDAAQQRQDYDDRIKKSAKQIAALNQKIALLETHRDIDREAYKDVETSLAKLQEKIQQQRDAIAFYRGIISPTDGQRGLRVQDLRLSKGTDERQYHVRLVLVQVMQHDRSVKGEVNFSLEGAQDGVATTYELEQLVPADQTSNWPFRFRYFQNFERQLILPEGFLPERINVEVRSRTKSIASIKQSFLWQTGQS
jgi:septal ring factor EnvC (AmiA/AmiB activator)